MALTAPDHVPRSGALLGINAAILVLAICVLGLTAYEESAYNQVFYSGDNILSGAIGFGLFTSIWTILFVVYFFVTTRRVYAGYHKFAALGLVISNVIFWLITWALFARIMSLLNLRVQVPIFSDGGDFLGYEYEDTADSTTKGVFAATLALSLIIWLLFIGETVLLLTGARSHGVAAGGTTTYEQGYSKEAPATELQQQTAPATTTGTTAPATTTAPTTTGTTETLPHAATPAQAHNV